MSKCWVIHIICFTTAAPSSPLCSHCLNMFSGLLLMMMWVKPNRNHMSATWWQPSVPKHFWAADVEKNKQKKCSNILLHAVRMHTILQVLQWAQVTKLCCLNECSDTCIAHKFGTFGVEWKWKVILCNVMNAGQLSSECSADFCKWTKEVGSLLGVPIFKNVNITNDEDDCFNTNCLWTRTFSGWLVQRLWCLWFLYLITLLCTKYGKTGFVVGFVQS